MTNPRARHRRAWAAATTAVLIAVSTAVSTAAVAGTSSAASTRALETSADWRYWVSVDHNRAQATDASGAPSISHDGALVAFESHAPLAEDDTNGAPDVYVWQRGGPPARRASVSTSEGQGNGASTGASISSDARYVAFTSAASDLVPEDTNGTTDVFVRNLYDETTRRVSLTSKGAQSHRASSSPSISADGRYVAFLSTGKLVPRDTNSSEFTDVYVRDLVRHTTRLVSINSKGVQSNGPSSKPAISGNGRYVAFTSVSSTLAPRKTRRSDVFVRDLKTGTTQRVSVNSKGVAGNRWSQGPAISADGRYVAFASASTNLVRRDTNRQIDVFVRDRMRGVTRRVSLTNSGGQGNGWSQGGAKYSQGVAMSANGKFIVFASQASNLVPGDSNEQVDVFMRDRERHTTMRTSVIAGAQGNDASDGAAISANGRWIVFSSLASNLVSGDTNGVWDVFYHDRGLRWR